MIRLLGPPWSRAQGQKRTFITVRQGGNMRSDSDIKRDVEEELKWEPNVDATDIAVAVKNGVVTLTGLVARIDRLAARSGRYKRAGSFLTSDNQPCRSKRTKIAVITSRSSGTE